MQLAQEMYSSKVHTFTGLDGVRQKVKSIGMRWNQIVAPAILKYAEETVIGGPESDELNGTYT